MGKKIKLEEIKEFVSIHDEKHDGEIINQSFYTATNQIVVFTLDEQSYALSLDAVIKVIHAIEIRQLPKAPEIITGIINVKGQIIPVVDIRKKFGMLARETELNDRLVIADTGKRKIAFLVDTIIGVKDLLNRDLVNSKEVLPFAEFIKGVAKVENEIILIYDLERFLSLDEEKVLENVLKTKIK